MSALLKKLFGRNKRKATKKDSVTGRNQSFPVPYLSRLEGNQLQPGQSLIVRGVITGKDQFIINLTSGPNVEIEQEGEKLDNRLLSIRVDVAKRKLFINACIDGEWGKEGSVKHGWQPGDEFDIRLRCHDDGFHIFVEHRLVAKFAHYQPVSNISHIYINGDCAMYTVNWEGKYYQMPYAADIPGNFYPGRKLMVSAVPAKGAKQFTVDFHAGKDIAFRLQPKFGEKKVVRNTRIDDKWGREETAADGPFPLKRKNAFDLIVYSDENRFLIYVDDCLFGTFVHRLPATQIDKISIEGDVELQGVHLK